MFGLSATYLRTLRLVSVARVVNVLWFVVNCAKSVRSCSVNSDSFSSVTIGTTVRAVVSKRMNFCFLGVLFLGV